MVVVILPLLSPSEVCPAGWWLHNCPILAGNFYASPDRPRDGGAAGSVESGDGDRLTD